jgi:hypothetical protein
LAEGLCEVHSEAEEIVKCQASNKTTQVVLCQVAAEAMLGNACCYSVQNLLSSRLLSKKLKIKTYRTIILPVALYGCEAWSLILREERRLKVFENRVLRRVFGPKRYEVTGE